MTGLRRSSRISPAAYGMALLERYIVEDLLGGRIAHCYGHHFSDPLGRLAFHVALSRSAEAPGTMIYGNTTSYLGDALTNYAALNSYLSGRCAGPVADPDGTCGQSGAGHGESTDSRY